MNIPEKYRKYDELLKTKLDDYRYIHSLGVAKSARHLAELYGADPEKAYFAGLLHDICKTGCYKKEPKNQKTYDPEKVGKAQRYQVKHDDMGDFIWETVMAYKFDDPMPYGHGEKSVYMISGFMKLTREEAMAIRWHMGAYSGEQDWRDLGKAYEQYPLALLTHFADMAATHIDEKE